MFVALRPRAHIEVQYLGPRCTIPQHQKSSSCLNNWKGKLQKVEGTTFYCEHCRLLQPPVSSMSMAGVCTTLSQCSISDLELGDRAACSYHLWRRDYRWLPPRAVEDPSEIFRGAGATQEIHVTKIPKYFLPWWTHSDARNWPKHCREINLMLINHALH